MKVILRLTVDGKGCDVQGRFQGTKDVVWLRENVVGWHRGQDTDYEKRIET